MPPPTSEPLNVIALVSGGKDSFFSLLHCQANGHRVVALANLHPAPASGSGSGPVSVSKEEDGEEEEHDLNSFMYQTVGHQVIPLYADATGLPLYRRAITGRAAQHGREYYSHHHHHHHHRRRSDDDDDDDDETESMVPLLRAVVRAHPEANAVCAGAVLSTYQRTRVESVATRLGLTPLAYLWKYPVLPAPAPVPPPPRAGAASPASAPGSDAQLLDDMAAAGLEARIVKVASGGLDDSFLWTDVATAEGKARLARAMRRFGAAAAAAGGGAVIGEGGEFETLVLDGPPALFRKRIVVAEEDRRVVSEGGGCAWLSLRNARLEDKVGESATGRGETRGGLECIRVPDLLDPLFASLLGALSSPAAGDDSFCSDIPQHQIAGEQSKDLLSLLGSARPSTKSLQQWCFVGDGNGSASIEATTRVVVDKIRQRLQQHSLAPSAILHATIVLRRMADFPAVNGVYGTLFDAPNPASRVTISCGDALSAVAAGADIAVYLTVYAPARAEQQDHQQQQQQQQFSLRQGLHVQSRSYWAPANIGPYSQAISVPVASLGSSSGEQRSDDGPLSSLSGPNLVTIAGQIPLVPASMALPVCEGQSDGDGDGEARLLRLQVVLSLQHLWRIGVEMEVQWWTSAVAYVARCGEDTESLKLKVELATRAWKAANASPGGSTGGDDGEQDGEEADQTGPDLWDRKFDFRFRTFGDGGDEGEKVGRALPDRGVLSPDSAAPLPPVFVAEVDELPRGAAIEWHAHLGIAHAGAASVVLRDSSFAGPDAEGWEIAAAVSQVIVKLGDGGKGVRYVQTVVAEPFDGGCQRGLCDEAARAALARLGRVVSSPEELAVLSRYVDAELWTEGGFGDGPVVPCRSLWDGNGARLAALTVYRSVFD